MDLRAIIATGRFPRFWHETMKTIFFVGIFSCSVPSAQAQTIPRDIWGKWVVSRTLPTARTISCWGDEEAKTLISSEIEYSAMSFRWKNVIVNNAVATTRTISAEQFHEENSARSARGSQITFGELGINTKQAAQISITHDPADITGATIEIPGDRVLIKSKNTLVFSVCGVYFEARRIAPPPRRAERD
jgi:hypothetical protein